MRGQRNHIRADAHETDAFSPAIAQHDAESAQVLAAGPQQMFLVRPGQRERGLRRARHPDGFAGESVSDHNDKYSWILWRTIVVLFMPDAPLLRIYMIFFPVDMQNPHQIFNDSA